MHRKWKWKYFSFFFLLKSNSFIFPLQTVPAFRCIFYCQNVKNIASHLSQHTKYEANSKIQCFLYTNNTNNNNNNNKLSACDIDELEKSKQKTENVTQINARHEISKCTHITCTREGVKVAKNVENYKTTKKCCSSGEKKIPNIF